MIRLLIAHPNQNTHARARARRAFPPPPCIRPSIDRRPRAPARSRMKSGASARARGALAARAPLLDDRWRRSVGRPRTYGTRQRRAARERMGLPWSSGETRPSRRPRAIACMRMRGAGKGGVIGHLVGIREDLTQSPRNVAVLIVDLQPGYSSGLREGNARRSRRLRALRTSTGKGLRDIDAEGQEY